jgi:hypothetical protein
VAASALVCLGCWAASAQAYVYWANMSLADPDASTIGRAASDGSGVEQGFMAGVDYPLSLAVDGSHLYWAGAGGIGRANLDGSDADPDFVTVPGSFYAAVAVDGSHIYWSDDVAGTIGRANLDGSDADPDFIADAGSNPLGLAADGSHVYWVNADGSSMEAIGRANVDGSGVEGSFITLPPSSSLCGVAVDGAHVYWSDEAGEAIGRADLDGSAVEDKFIAAEAPCELALDGSHVYWAGQANNAIGRADLDGSAVEQSLIPSAAGSYPIGVAADPLPAPAPPAPGPAPTSPPNSTPSATPTPSTKGGVPDTIIRAHPKAKVKTGKVKAMVRFTFASDQAGATFRCALDKGKFKPCSSPAIYAVKPGRHRFRVEALGAAGTDPTPGSFSFRVVRKKSHGASGRKARRHH